MATQPSVPDNTSTPSAAPKIRMYRAMYGAMDELRTEIKKEHVGAIRWKKRFVGLGLIAVLMMGGIVAAITATNNSYAGVSGETYSYDTTLFAIVSQGHNVASSTQAAAGAGPDIAGSVEMSASAGGAVRTALTAGHWVYQAQITEASVNAIPNSGQTRFFKAELLQDGTSLGTVYFKNVDLLDLTSATTVEGVTAKWAIGASLPTSASYVVKITQVSA